MGEKRTIVERLVAAGEKVGAVAKSDKNQHQGFNFRGIDAVVNAASPALKAEGVITVPRVDSVAYESVLVGRNRTEQVSCRVIVAYEFHGPDGDMVSARVAAEAMDSGDKATAKAMSVAFRIALLQVLALPTHEPDPDHDSYQRVSARGVNEVSAAIGAAATLDDLRLLWAEARQLGLADEVNARREELEA